jgi:hypothetical protein
LCDQDYKGIKPASEPETQAIQRFIESKQGWLSVICVHCYGAFWIFNRDADKFPRKFEFIEMCEKAVLAKNKIKEVTNNEYAFGTPVSTIGCNIFLQDFTRYQRIFICKKIILSLSRPRVRRLGHMGSDDRKSEVCILN